MHRSDGWAIAMTRWMSSSLTVGDNLFMLIHSCHSAAHFFLSMLVGELPSAAPFCSESCVSMLRQNPLVFYVSSSRVFAVSFFPCSLPLRCCLISSFRCKKRPMYSLGSLAPSPNMLENDSMPARTPEVRGPTLRWPSGREDRRLPSDPVQWKWRFGRGWMLRPNRHFAGSEHCFLRIIVDP